MLGVITKGIQAAQIGADGQPARSVSSWFVRLCDKSGPFVSSVLVVASRDAAVVLDALEEVLDAVALAVESPVVGVLALSMTKVVCHSLPRASVVLVGLSTLS